MSLRTLPAFVTAVAIFCVAATGCAWHEVSPRISAPPSARIKASMAVRPVDEDTAIADLDSISKRFRSWGNSKVIFPYRDGDAVDLMLDVKLRQTTEPHMFGNFLRAIALGLSLGLLSPVVGPHMTEVHDVDVRIALDGRQVGAHHFQMKTDLYFGMGSNPHTVAKDLDDEQMNRIAKRLIELVATDVAKSGTSKQALRIAIRLDATT